MLGLGTGSMPALAQTFLEADPAAAADRVSATADPAATPRFGVTRFIPSLDARVVYTNNPGPDEKTNLIHRDTVVEVQPSVVFERRGPRITLTGNLAVSAIDYLQDSHPGRLLPRGRVDLQTKLVEDWIYFDAVGRVDPTFEDPFVTRPGDETSYKLEPRTRYTLSPYLSRRFTEATSLLVRTDYGRTRITDVSTPEHNKTNVKSLDNTVILEHRPVPFGYSLEARSHDESDDRVAQAIVKERNGRLWLDYAISPQVIFGAVAGREEATFIGNEVIDNFYGGRVRLRPTDRTDVRVTVEQRYFGKGYDASFEHRQPTYSFSFRTGRTVTSQDVPQSVFAADGDFAAALNNSLLTRFPNDPAGRQREVDRIIASINPLDVTATNLTFHALQPQLRQNASLNFGIFGRRNAILLKYGYLKVEALPSSILLLPVATDTITQKAASLGWGLRLTPLATFNAVAEWARTDRNSDSPTAVFAEQRSYRAETAFRLSQTSSITVGARYLTIRATENFLTYNDTVGEKAVYAGLHHRF